MLTAISVIDVINAILVIVVLAMLVVLLLRMQTSTSIREEIHHILDEVQALRLRMNVHEQTSPCEHCRLTHGQDIHDHEG